MAAKDKAVEEAPSGFESMVGTDGDSQALATIDGEQETRVASPSWTSTPEFEEGETGYPLLRLGQGLTPEVAEGSAKMGDWLLNGYPPMQAVTLIPMFFARTRRRNDPSDRTNTLCSSADALTGRGEPGGSCRACPHAQWTENPRTGRRQRPACDLTFNYGAYSVEHGQVVQVGFKGTATSAAQTINNLVVANRGMGGFAIQLRSKQDRSGANVYAVPLIQTVRMRPEWRSMVDAILNPGLTYDEVDPDDLPEDAIVQVESEVVSPGTLTQ